MNILENTEDKKKWEELIFTDKGIVTLKTYLYSLSKVYVENKKYPIMLPPIIGIPTFKFSNYITSKDELMGRIKILSQLFGVKSIKVETKNTTKILELIED